MKKCILSILLSLLFCLSNIYPPNAPLFPCAQTVDNATPPSAGTYACILNDDAFFYPTRDEKRGLFLLPKTYFVKILEFAEDFCKIEYLYDDTYAKKLVGYAKTQDLTFVNFIPNRPYLYHLFEVSYHIENESGLTDGFLNTYTFTCAYYGDFQIGSDTYCYVLRGNEFGYIPKPSHLSYPENTEYAEHLTATTPPQEDIQDEPPTSETQSSPAQIAILISLCILVPLLAALILKPPHRPTFDDEE